MKRAWQVLEVLMAIGGAVWLIRYVYIHRADLTEILHHPPIFLVAICISVIATWFVSALQTKVLVKSQGVEIGAGESFLLMASSSLLNYVPLRFGTLLRLRYMRVTYGLHYAKNLGLIALRMIISVFFCTLIAIIGLSAMGTNKIELETIFILACALAISTTILLVPVSTIKEQNGKIRKFMHEVSNVIVTARHQRKLIISLTLLLLIQITIVAFRLQMSFEATGQSIDWPVLFVISPITLLLTFVSVAPLGLREALVGGIVAVSGQSFSAGVIAASVDRAALIVLSVTVGSVATGVLLRRLYKLSKRTSSAKSFG